MIPSRPDIMGVVNITPNSFSDGNQFNKKDAFNARMNELFSRKVNWVDIGAESTAPFNDPVTEKEEQSRFAKIFFPWIEQAFEFPVVSIDTYRPSTFVFVNDFLKKHSKKTSIWNDVSGVMDENVFEILKARPDCFYVYCSTNIQRREHTSRHMENPFNCKPEEITDAIKKDFFSVYEVFKSKGMEDRLIFDPAFGFSKTFSQNWELIKNLGPLIESFPQNIPWIIGISRKSFLKEMTFKADPDKILVQTEYLQTILISRWLEKFGNRPVFFRLHDPGVFAMAKILEEKNVS
ncbi:MAG: dihydropteroate synthase [Halobacteriovoraceae bacterium]|nr:dihydropteroate synthase [Halobacteriovoraceae bacterium]